MNIPDMMDNRVDIGIAPVAERTSAILEYQKILALMLNEINAEMNRSVIPAYNANESFIMDSDSWFLGLRGMASEAVRKAVLKVNALMGRESASHADRLQKAIKRGTKLDIAKEAFTNTPAEARLARTYLEYGASQVKSLSDDMLKRIEGVIYQGKISRDSPAKLSRALRNQFRIARNRAKFIAVNQLSSLNADLTELRHKAVGIDRYMWVHRGDDRVRSLHRRLGDRRVIYKYGERTAAEGGQAPGKPPNCRCIARGIIPAKSASAARRTRNALLSTVAIFTAGVIAGSQTTEEEGNDNN